MARIFIIDDDTSVSLTFARMLELAGHRVERLESAQTGLDHLGRDCPDAVILDIRMPAMDGMEFLRRVRADPVTAHLPIGIVTGDYFLKEDVLEELATLGVEIRYKPLWMDDLHELAGTLLASGGSAPPKPEHP
jgi:CheY-like chemotaxis protein